MDRLSRDARWNLSLAVLVLSSALVARLTGTPIGAVLGGAAALGAVLGVATFRIARSRDPWQRYLREQARTAPAQSRPALPIRAAGERAT